MADPDGAIEGSCDIASADPEGELAAADPEGELAADGACDGEELAGDGTCDGWEPPALHAESTMAAAPTVMMRTRSFIPWISLCGWMTQRGLGLRAVDRVTKGSGSVGGRMTV
jgi:hypothetical protein